MAAQPPAWLQQQAPQPPPQAFQAPPWMLEPPMPPMPPQPQWHAQRPSGPAPGWTSKPLSRRLAIRFLQHPGRNLLIAAGVVLVLITVVQIVQANTGNSSSSAAATTSTMTTALGCTSQRLPISPGNSSTYVMNDAPCTNLAIIARGCSTDTSNGYVHMPEEYSSVISILQYYNSSGSLQAQLESISDVSGKAPTLESVNVTCLGTGKLISLTGAEYDRILGPSTAADLPPSLQ